MIFLVLGAVLLAILVGVGRASGGRVKPLRLAWALVAALCAGLAVFVGLRGQWLISLGLVAFCLWLGASARPGASPGGSAPKPPLNDALSVQQARLILGVAPGADREAIEAAYRRMMRRAHPDVGGSSGLAAQVNAARERLLG